jgi:hypothetical protein
VRYDARVRSTTLLALVLVACGGATVEAPDDDTPTLTAPATDSAAFLLEVGATLTDCLVPPTETIDALEASRRAARGVERRRVEKDLMRAHLFAAETAEGREQTAHYRAIQDLSTSTVRIRDEDLLAQIDFLALWGAWRSGHRSADQRAQRFVTHHEASHDLVLMAWIIRGEVAFADHRWDDALESFRAVLGRLGHPLYAFALYRSARCWLEQGRTDDSRQALNEVRDLACSTSASAPTIHIALAATTALGEQTVTDATGHERPASCATHTTTSSSSSLEDERPPGVH